MDPVTHGLIGATAAQTLADSARMKMAAAIGFTAALLADVDVFIHRAGDSLFNVEIHRQFTHSLIFIPVGALVATILAWWFVRKKLTVAEVYLFSLLGYATSGLTDSLTSYGTQLLWPFWDERFAWNLISVFDPLFTVGILITVALSLVLKKKQLVYFSWGWILMYLTFGFIQNYRATEAAEQLIQERNHNAHQVVVKPAIGNQFLWGVRYAAGDSIYGDGIRPGFLSDIKVYEGESAPVVNWREEYAEFKGTTLFNDIQRFSALSEGLLVRHPHHEQIIGDGRYAMLPTSMEPLWGIAVDTSNSDKHVPFLNYRNADMEIRKEYLRMIFGK